MCATASKPVHVPGAALGLEMRFAPTYALLCLHVWLALVRLRAEGRDGRDMAQMMYEDFQEDVERRVRAEGVKVGFPSWHGRDACLGVHDLYFV